MKLKTEFVVSYIDDVQYLVPVGGFAFKGMIRSNPTAAYIVEQLAEDITRDQIVDAMCRKFDAPRGIIEEDVDATLDTLRSVGALEE